ncbi:MAG: hypothetical protein KA170_02130 [Candidatus Promineofilum sp.]|nr:hypothetical protein [Promineifilum sp.]
MTTSIGGSTVLATNSQALAIGLSALLLSIPPISQVNVVADVGSMLQVVTEKKPILVILDIPLVGPRLDETTRELRLASPQALHVLLSDNVTQFRELFYHSQELVIVKGTDPARLARSLEILLNGHVSA